MSFPNRAPAEVERDRQRQVSEMAGESGPGWADEYRAGSAGCHELLDRTALLADMLERYLVSHPACVANPAWYLLAEQAAAALHELYQQIGAAHLESAGPSGQEATGPAAR
jgi:hypothetical protein